MRAPRESEGKFRVKEAIIEMLLVKTSKERGEKASQPDVLFKKQLNTKTNTHWLKMKVNGSIS